MWYKAKIISTFLVFSLICLSGCSTTNSTPKLNLLTLNIAASNKINPNANNQASPVVITIYQLQSNSKFMTADFFSLYQKPQQTLSAAYLNSQQYTVLPGQKTALKINLAKNTAYIGVVAAYQNILNANWIDSEAINPKMKKDNLYLTVNQSSIAFVNVKK